MRCGGLHCGGCARRSTGTGTGGPGSAAGHVVLLIIIGVGVRIAWPHIASAVETAGWAAAGLSAAVITTTITVRTARAVRRAHARRALTSPPPVTITTARQARLTTPQPAALPPGQPAATGPAAAAPRHPGRTTQP